MSTPPARLIVNPRAGHGRGRRYARRIRRYLEAGGLGFRGQLSRGPGDIERQVREACAAGVRHVVVAGGNGTVHEAVNGLLAAGTDTALGLVPLGTGNDFAKALAIPRNWRGACDRVVQCIRSGVARQVDAVRCNDFFFANGLGLGLDARVTRASLAWKWLPGSGGYLLGLARVLAGGIPATRAWIETGAETVETELCMAVACNGQYVGGVFHIAPQALIDDRLLQLVLVAPVTRIQALRWAPKVIRGTHQNLPVLRVLDVTRARIRLADPVPVEADGELREAAATELDIRLLPGALRVLA